MTEIWKPIKGTVHYSASDCGNVRNDKTGNILKPYIVGATNNQYYAVDLYPKKHIRLHRIIAECFIPNPEGKKEINHIDGDHFNNSVNNLEWVTGSENCLHAYRVLRKKKLAGKENPNSKQIIRIEDGRFFETLSQAAEECGLSSHSNISKALKNKNRKAGGYHWQYYGKGAEI